MVAMLQSEAILDQSIQFLSLTQIHLTKSPKHALLGYKVEALKNQR